MVGVSEYYTTVDGDSRSEPLTITAAKMIELNPFLFHINFRNADSYRSTKIELHLNTRSLHIMKRIDNFHYRLILKLGKEMQINHLS